jgi:hypothetical protein
MHNLVRREMSNSSSLLRQPLWSALTTLALSVSAGGAETALTRSAAVESLTAALDAANRETDIARQLAILCGQAFQVSNAFPDNVLLRSLFENAASAANRSTNEIVAEWTKSVREAIDVLEFQVTEEAPLPEGFPKPSPLGEICIKSYPSYRMARTPVHRDDDQAFFSLFSHITANKVAMTAPVEMTYSKGDAEFSRTTMAFLYGNRQLGQLGGDSVHVQDVGEAKVLSIGIRGPMTDDRVAQAVSRLELWLNRHGLKAIGEPRAMCYNSPFLAAEKQLIEVQVPISLVESSHEAAAR